MFDYLRNLTKSDAEKHQEALNAYLDNALTSKEKQRFEQHLAQNPDLQAQLSQIRSLKQQMRGLPQRRVPRNFMLDPQKYGRPQSAFLIQAYPFLRTATALTAFFFVFAIAATIFLGGLNSESVAETASMAAPIPESSNIVELPFEETVVEEGETVEVTRVVTEEVVEAPALELMEEEAVAMDEAAPPAESQSEGEGIETQRESAPVAEMPLDGTDMIAGTTEFDDADLAASSELEVPAAEELAEDLDEGITIAQAAATQIAVQTTDSDEFARQTDDAVSNRDLPKETIDQRQVVVDPLLGVTLLLGVLLLVLLLLTWSARRRF